MKFSSYAVLLVTLYAFTLCLAQTRCPNLDKNKYVRRGEYVRSKDDCFQGYRCFRAELVPYQNPCANDSFYSLSTGVCSFEGKSISLHFGVSNCEDESKKFDLDRLAAKREEVCSKFGELDADDKTNNQHLYAGDPESCVGYFNCRAGISEDFYLICHRGTEFFDDKGRCDWPAPESPSCNRKFSDS